MGMDGTGNAVAHERDRESGKVSRERRITRRGRKFVVDRERPGGEKWTVRLVRPVLIFASS